MRQITWAAVLLAVAVLVVGCRVDSERQGSGKKVEIDTPFGGMHVQTNNADVLGSLGLPGYPGATPAKKDSGNDDNESADVNMSFGGFQLRVKAASFHTSDPADKVEAFYRSGLKRFGDVIACRDERPVGTPVRTAEGLTCDEEKDSHVHVGNHGDGKLELKAGSRLHQHLVQIDRADGSGTKFELVALDLPGRIFSNGGDDNHAQ